jgi:hypothetical protein
VVEFLSVIIKYLPEVISYWCFVFG